MGVLVTEQKRKKEVAQALAVAAKEAFKSKNLNPRADYTNVYRAKDGRWAPVGDSGCCAVGAVLVGTQHNEGRRTAFFACAKHMGCTLDDIGEFAFGFDCGFAPRILGERYDEESHPIIIAGWRLGIEMRGAK